MTIELPSPFHTRLHFGDTGEEEGCYCSLPACNAICDGDILQVTDRPEGGGLHASPKEQEEELRRQWRRAVPQASECIIFVCTCMRHDEWAASSSSLHTHTCLPGKKNLSRKISIYHRKGRYCLRQIYFTHTFYRREEDSYIAEENLRHEQSPA